MAVNKGSDVVAEFFCSTCQDNNIHMEAEFYCQVCTKFYCVQCVTLHSQLFKKHTAFGKEQLNSWPVSKPSEDVLEKCELHTDKKIELVCEDHTQLCCSMCVLLNHRHCIKVTLISECAKDKNLGDFQQLSTKIQTILGQLNEIQTNRKSNIQSLETVFNDRLQEIADARRKINVALDELEKTTLKELNEVRAELNASFKEDVDNSARVHDVLKSFSDIMCDIVNRRDHRFFIAHWKCLEKVKLAEAYLRDNTKHADFSLTFQVNTDIEQYISRKSGLGLIEYKSPLLPEQDIPNQVITVSSGQTSLTVKMSSDSSAHYQIRGLCSLPNGQTLVLDSSNNRVKLFNEQHQAVSHCDVHPSPHDLCPIAASEVAVTGTDCSLQFIKVINGQLVKDRKLQLPNRCVGISHHQGDLFITSGTALHHYTIAGELVNKLYEDTSRAVTVYKCAVNLAGDRIFVTDNSRHRLLTLARDGTLLSTFTDTELQHPQGVHVTPTGHVLVCGYKSNTVIQVNSEGRKKTATVVTQKDGVVSPMSVCYNTNTDSLVVGQQSSTILVFKCK